MSTDKPSRRLYFSPEKLRELYELWEALRVVGRRRQPEYIGLRLDFNPWLMQLIDERAAQVRGQLAAADAAPRTFGMVDSMPKSKTAATKKTKTPKPSEPPAPEARRGPRPGSGKKDTLNLSLDKDVIEWLRAQPSPSTTANTILRRSMLRSKRT